MTPYEKVKNIITRGTYEKEFLLEMMDTFVLAKRLTSEEYTELAGMMV